ncbi:hypothetical protein BOTBODRAFT_478461 [Botryobasidium botryosum FD-172 SS1]|uniref:Uncharacterized protein n=1 Tax=Botryobasidium botryosum (strain FD-172 SS1) TaxID=930990 RepID=A0A067MW34_BOTB1|nr:hypothetical protein BOTBODRAFT_478461 [Botryobasidium botryosum FD-172 SS1]
MTCCSYEIYASPPPPIKCPSPRGRTWSSSAASSPPSVLSRSGGSASARTTGAWKRWMRMVWLRRGLLSCRWRKVWKPSRTMTRGATRSRRVTNYMVRSR